MTQVTVVIPVYNRAHLVGEAVTSVLAQDVVADVVIVDDGSTDETWATIERLASESDGRVRALRRANGGPSAARNTALAVVDDGLITFLDSDDLMEPGRLAKQIAAWSTDPGGVIVMGQERIEIADGVEPSPHILGRLQKNETRYPMSVMLSVEQLHAVGGLDEELRFAEDVDFIRRLEEAGNRLVVLDDVLLTRRIFGDNLVLEPDVDRSLFLLLRRRAQRAREQA
jgi:glycosyltransferase involved in cell wall biosynthesis